MRISTAGFGPWIADGVTDCSTTLLAALSALSTSADRLLELDHNGTVMLQWSNSNGYSVPAGVSIVGRGANTILQCIPSSITGAGNWGLFVLDAGSNVLKNFVIDGNSGAITASGALGNNGIWIASNDNVVENVEIHHIYNNTGESFGVACQGVNNRLVNCHCHHIIGSGISVNGPGTVNATAPFVTGYGTIGCVVNGCVSHDNTWMGITMFVVQDCQIIGGLFYNNSKRGINTEWSSRCTVSGANVFGNTFAGIGTYGICVDWTLSGCNVHDNNQALQAEQGELEFAPGTLSGHRGICQSAHITGCTVVPSATSNGSCLSVAEGDTTIDRGPTTATSITVSGPDVDNWTYSVNNSPFDAKYMPQGVFIKGLETVGGLATGHPSSWTLTNITVGVTPTGDLSINTAKKFTQTAANTATNSVSATLLTKGGRYLVSYRLCPQDGNAEWELSVNGQSKKLRVRHGATDIGNWVAGTMLVTIPPNFGDNFLQLGTVSNTASASAIGVDWVAAMRVDYLGSASGS